MIRLFIKGIVRMTGDDMDFETIEEESFVATLTKGFCTAQDLEVHFDDELKASGWKIEPKEDDVYAVILELTHHSYQDWYSGEWDSNVDLVKLDVLFLGNYDDLYSEPPEENNYTQLT